MRIIKEPLPTLLPPSQATQACITRVCIPGVKPRLTGATAYLPSFYPRHHTWGRNPPPCTLPHHVKVCRSICSKMPHPSSAHAGVFSHLSYHPLWLCLRTI